MSEAPYPGFPSTEKSRYVPKPKPGVFRVTKTIHNILQGVAEPGVRISEEEKAAVDGWITEHAERYWLGKHGPLQPPSEGGADIIVVSASLLLLLFSSPS